jgi:hypothetical protein
MNEQIIATIIAAVLGFLANAYLKRIEKEQSVEEKEKVKAETAEKIFEITKQMLEIAEKKNKELEQMIEDIPKLKKKINDLYDVIYALLDEECIPDDKKCAYNDMLMKIERSEL